MNYVAGSMSSWLRRGAGGGVAAGIFVAGAQFSADAQTKAAPGADWTKTLYPFLTKYCLPCHQSEAPPGGVRFDNIKSEAQAIAARPFFDRAAERMKAKEMPPFGSPQPTDVAMKNALTAIQRIFAKAPPAPPDPGRVTMRRLNRAEYDNTLRDLLKIDFKPSVDFPNDDVGYGFDNIGDVLTLSPLLFEKYLNAAEKAAAQAIELPRVRTVRFDPSRMDTDIGNLARGDSLGLNSAGYAAIEFMAPEPGPYRLRIEAYATQAGPDAARMAVRLGEKELQTFNVDAVPSKPGTYELPLDLPKGQSKIFARFTNDYYQPNHADPKMRGDRNLYVMAFEVTGPLVAGAGPSAAHQSLILKTPSGKDFLPAAKENLRPFLRRAFRRPTTEAEVERYAKFVAQAQREGETFEEGMRIAVAAALVSPHFLFRIELDQPTAGTKTTVLNDHQLASRLSYFLWSSMPDPELMQLADRGLLKNPATLRSQADRMLKDPKAAALTQNFANQWLTLRKLDDLSPDPELFPSYDDRLRDDMKRETEMFFADVVRSDRSVVEFLDAPYTFLNARLARHYGVPNIAGENFRKVTLPNSRRGGLLTMASVLTVTSNPNRTSPVKRGKWVMENILGSPPPPPPPGIDSLEGDTDKVPAKTIRDRMERHRRDPSCAVCHAKMDPLGLAFENYDAVGRWRTKDGRFAVDASGAFDGKEKFKDAVDLKKILLKRKAAFAVNLTEKLMTYGLGRGVELSDRKAVQATASQSEKEGFRFSSIVKGIVSSDAFRKKKGD
ncbi:MAG TPA: DUF1592 domain-containing protein [Fimbriimonadaceae bacterium]|nr:DUF1592 domain-containing protein [Fimbriimonadaceae bacterium]